MWKEVVKAWRKYYPGICLKRLRKLRKTLSQDSPAWDLNQAPLEYMSEAYHLIQLVMLLSVLEEMEMVTSK
jgi:hypothetical protein